MRSMTGFGRSEGSIGISHFTIEVKSVNHRFLDVRFRIPSALSLYESAFAERLRSQFERGSFEVNIKHRLAPTGATLPASTRFVVDELAAKSFFESCEWLKKNFKLEKGATLETFLASDRVIVPFEENEEPQNLMESVRQLFDQALSGLATMRASEGKELKVFLNDGIESLLGHVAKLAELAPQQRVRIQERLQTRIASWGLTQPVDAQRLEVEVAFLAERSDITEELDRLRAHAEAFKTQMGAGKAIGRKLDFLTQELHREVNTLGAKAALVEMTRHVVEAKAIVEKLREQVQNVE